MSPWTPPMYMLASLAAIAGLWIMVVKVIPGIVIENFRNRLFAIRNELFDRALDGEIAFDHPAYVMLRASLNGHLRFAHNLSFLEIAVFHKVYRDDPERREVYDRFVEALDECTPAQREFIARYMADLSDAVVRRLVQGSWMMVVPIIPVVMALVLRKPLERRLRKPLESLNMAALQEGEGHCFAGA